MLILKARDGTLYAIRAEEKRYRLSKIHGPGREISGRHDPHEPLAPGVYPVGVPEHPKMTAVEAYEPEGEAGALTRAVLEYRDALEAERQRFAGFLSGDRADHPGLEDGLRLVKIVERMIALAEAIAETGAPAIHMDSENGGRRE